MKIIKELLSKNKEHRRLLHKFYGNMVWISDDHRKPMMIAYGVVVDVKGDKMTVRIRSSVKIGATSDIAYPEEALELM